MISNKRSNLLLVLITLTFFAIIAQITFFVIHYHVTDLLDSLVASSIKGHFLHPAVILPLLGFITIQLLSYAFFIFYIWFIARTNAEFFKVSEYWLGIFFWGVGAVAVMSLNNYFFSGSFFAGYIRHNPEIYGKVNTLALAMSVLILAVATVIAYSHVLKAKRYYTSALVLFVAVLLLFAAAEYDEIHIRSVPNVTLSRSQPNIILIGLDSARPDFTSFFSASTKTPNIHAFLQQAVTFKEAYTPLARTFPSWVSILTGQYPKHHHARINLDDPNLILPKVTLATYLQQQGYETIYATDEKRFSNITEGYGFDQVWGPKAGINDFLLAGLSDFPLTNLSVNLPIGRWLFPYNYANRAGAVTYEPSSFLHLLDLGLSQRQTKPLFLAVHFCLSHWPYTWAGQNGKGLTSADRYRHSLEAVDQQLGEFFAILAKRGLLKNTLVVLLSDHGTTVGLPGDRLISEDHYQGPAEKLKWVSLFKAEDGKRRLNTSYGQGTDVLSLKQYRVLLAMKGYGITTPAKQISERSSLLDITPTILDFLHIKPSTAMDGISQADYLLQPKQKANLHSRPLYLESGYSISEIESKDIFVNQVVKRTIGLYDVNTQNGLLYVKPRIEQSIIMSKQRAVLSGDWLLAYYPAKTRKKMIKAKTGPLKEKQAKVIFKSYTLPPYFVLVNLKTGQWAVDMTSSLAKAAPLGAMLKQFKNFYGDEVSLKPAFAASKINT